MPGGGGANAEVGFPDYIENQHANWLNNGLSGGVQPYLTVSDVLDDLLPAAGNPHMDHNFTNFEENWTASQTRLDNHFALLTAFSPSEDWCSYLQKAADKVRTCTDTDIDTAAILTASLADAVTFFQKLQQQNVTELFDEETLLASWGDLVKGFLDTTDLFLDVDFDALASGSITKADAATAAAIAAVETGIDLVPDWGVLLDAAVAKAGTAGVLIATDIDASGFDYSDLATKYGDLLTAITGHDPDDDWDSYLSSVVASIDTAGVLVSLSRQDIDALVTAAQEGATDEITAAVAAAVAAAEDSVLATLVTEYGTRHLTEKARSVRRFFGGMADANAEHSSAFLIGHALIEAEHLRTVAEFDSQLSLAAFQEGFRGHLDAYGRQLAAELEAAIQAKVSRETLLVEGVRAVAQLFIEKIRAYNGAIDLLRQINLDQLRAELEARIRDKVSRDTFILQGASQLSQLKAEEWSYEKFIQGLYGDIYRALLATGLQSELAIKTVRDGLAGEALRALVNITSMNKDNQEFYLGQFARAFGASADAHLQGTGAVLDARTRLVSQAQGAMSQLTSAKFGAIQAAIAGQLEQNRMEEVLGTEHETAQFDKDVQAALWNLDVYERATTVLSGPAGMQGRIPPKNSRASSALGGALGGIVAGSELGTVGGVPGVVVGGVLGGLAGYFG